MNAHTHPEVTEAAPIDAATYDAIRARVDQNPTGAAISNLLDNAHIPPHRLRVFKEKAELDERIDKLNAFTDTPVFAALPTAESGARLDQLIAMRDYSRCLGRVICGWAYSSAEVAAALENAKAEAEAPHKPTDIKGYRNLSPEAVALMNEVKAHAEDTRELIQRVKDEACRPGVLLDDYNDSARWIGLAQDDLQTGYMKLIRAITRPTTF